MPLDLTMPDGVGARLRLAENLRRAGNEAGAEAAYRATLALEPTHLAASLGVAQILARRTGPAAALPVLAAASAAHPAHGGARLELAETLRRSGDAVRAEPEFRRVADTSPSHAAGALLGLARIARDRGAPEALEHFRAALAASADSLGLRLELAQELARLGRTGEAEVAYRAVLELSPTHLGGLLALGQAARTCGDRDAALAHFQTAAAAHSAHPGAATELAHALRDVGRLDEAEACYGRAIALAGRTRRQAVAAQLGLGLLARVRGDRNASLAAIERAHALAAAEGGDASLAPTIELAAEHRDRGAHDEAGRLLDSLRPDGTPPLALLLARGQLQRAQGDRAGALVTFEKAARQHPSHPQPLVDAALEHRALGEPEAAVASLHAALAIDPAHLGARLQYSDLLWQAEDTAGSLAICQALIAARPGALQPRLDAARALAQLGRDLEAMDLLDEATAQLGRHPAIALRRAELLTAAGEVAAARATLAAASTAAPHHLGLRAREAQAALTLGDLAGATAPLDPARGRPQTAADDAALAMLRGQIADARWRPNEALAAYDAALRHDPLHYGALAESARASLLLMDVDDAWRRLDASLRAAATGHKLRGGPSRASQHHLGQILDELRIDRQLTCRLAHFGLLPAADRLAHLLDIVRVEGTQTGPAIALMLALRQAGLLDRAAVEGGVPRRIGQYWDAPEPPEDVGALMRGWPNRHSGWDHQVYDDIRARDFLSAAAAAGEIGPNVPDAYLRAAMPAQKADLFRLAWLTVVGGWWIDADDRCVGRLDALAPGGANLIAYQEEYATLGNNLVGAVPGHPVIRHALDLGAEAVNRGDADIVWLSTGPALLTRAFAERLARDGGLEAPWLVGTAIIERGTLARSVARHCRAAYKTTDRHWLRAIGGQRRTELTGGFCQRSCQT